MPSSFINPSPSINAAGTSPKRMWHGVYNASVVSVNDPLQQNRITLKVPQVLGTATSNWAEPLGFIAQIPAPNSIVKVMFVGGDINHPVYMNSTGVLVQGTASDVTQTITSTATQATDGSSLMTADWETSGGEDSIYGYEWSTLAGPAWDPHFGQLLMATADPVTVNTSLIPVAGRVYFTSMFASFPLTISTVHFLAGETTGNTAPGVQHVYVGIYNQSFSLVAASPDVGSYSYGTFQGEILFPMGTTCFIPAGQFFFAAILSVYSSDPQPSFFGYSPFGSTFDGSATRFAYSPGTSYTSLPSIAPITSSTTSDNLCFWAGVS